MCHKSVVKARSRVAIVSVVGGAVNETNTARRDEHARAVAAAF
jgi:hypothetical protein